MHKLAHRFRPTPVDLLVGVLLCLLVVCGVLRPLESKLIDWRFQLLDRTPSETLVIVEIDPHSLEQEARWPWSRALYARAVRNLKEAGATVVAFDVDFSSRGDAEGDRLFREALSAYPGQVLLPEFYQTRSLLRDDVSLKRTAPNAYFLDSAAIATVNLWVEPNGVVRRGWCGSTTGGSYRGSIASILANQPPSSCSFLIDYSIDAAKIDRLSFVDVERGRFDPAAVAGKQVFIGATALELGDEFATPIHGLMPGILLHALSYESLVQGRTIQRVNDGPIIVLATLLFAFLVRAGARWSRRTLGVHVLTLTLAFAVPLAVQAVAPLSINTAPVIAAQLLAVSWMVITEMKRRARALLSQQLETLKHQTLIALVVRDSSDGVIITDERGRIEVCNERASVLLGAEDRDLAGALILEAAPHFPVLNDDRRRSEGTAPTLIEYVTGKPAGERVLEIASASTSQANNTWLRKGVAANELYFAYSLRDVTARKAMEKAERAAKEAAVAAANFKNELISNMSHELRTPLNSIIGFAAVFLRDDLKNLDSAEHRKYAEFIHGSGQRLLRLVNDILFMSQADAGEISLNSDTYSLREVWEDCAAKFARRIAQEGKSVAVHIPRDFPSLSLDGEIMSRAFTHLISNAVKFTVEGGAIALRAEYSATTGVRITVEDNGVGVAEEHLPKLSDAFFQADASLHRDHEGAGLGLYVARKCVAMHGGTLDFESAHGAGFKAIMTLPSSVAKATRAAA